MITKKQHYIKSEVSKYNQKLRELKFVVVMLIRNSKDIIILYNKKIEIVWIREIDKCVGKGDSRIEDLIMQILENYV